MDILQFLDIGPDVTRVGLLQYGSTVKNEFSLKTFKRKSEVERAIKRMRHLSTGTMTGLAIQYALNIAFSEAEGARPLRENVPRVIMIVTDGRPQDSVAEVAAKARNTGILIFAIGVGQVDFNTLKAIGSEPHEDHVFLVANFSQMESLTSVFQTKLCSKSCSGVTLLWESRRCVRLSPSVGSGLPGCRDSAGQGCSPKAEVDTVFFGGLALAKETYSGCNSRHKQGAVVLTGSPRKNMGQDWTLGQEARGDFPGEGTFIYTPTKPQDEKK